MWALLAQLFGRKPPPSPTGEALAAPLAASRPAPGTAETVAALVFTPDERYQNDPVFLSRVQWRLQELMYDGGEPTSPAETATRDRVREMGIARDLPRAYHLSDGFAPTVPLYVADVAIPPALYDAGFNFNDHDRLLRVRYDLSGPRPAAELVADPLDPTAIARRRLEMMLRRGARFIWAELVQANYRLYEPGTDSAACVVMFSFDFTVAAEQMRAWAAQLHPLKFTNPADPVLRKAVWPLEVDDRAWYYHRRFQVPDAFTGGRVVYLADLQGGRTMKTPEKQELCASNSEKRCRFRYLQQRKCLHFQRFIVRPPCADLWVHRPFIDGRFLQRQELGGQPRRVPLLAEKQETGWAGIELVPFDETDTYRRRATRANRNEVPT